MFAGLQVGVNLQRAPKLFHVEQFLAAIDQLDWVSLGRSKGEMFHVEHL